MSDGSTSTRHSGVVDWAQIERSPKFRELTARRNRFITGAAIVTFVGFFVYLGLATFAGDFMGTMVGGVPIAWLAAMSQVLLTWGVTWAYLRKADRSFAPLEREVADRAGARDGERNGGRFTREEPARAGNGATRTERSER